METTRARLSAETVAERLRNLTPEAVKAEDRIGWGYQEAAAVLSFYDPRTLKPTIEVPDPQVGLAQLIDFSAVVPGPDGRPKWTLRDDVRRQALLRAGGPAALLHALSTNSPSDDILQKALTSYIKGTALPLERQTTDELSQSSKAVEWLQGVIPDLPTAVQVRGQLQLHHLLRPLRDLVGTHFRGRISELQKLSDYAGVLPPSSNVEQFRRVARRIFSLKEKPPLLVYGPGGVGKSTLLAQFFLQHIDSPESPKIPFAYLDVDRPSLSIDQPLTMLIEAVRQLAIQYPVVRDGAESLEQRCRGLLSIAKQDRRRAPQTMPNQSVATDRPFIAGLLQQFSQLLTEAGLSETVYLFVVDTFEEAQYRSRNSVREFGLFSRGISEKRAFVENGFSRARAG